MPNPIYLDFAATTPVDPRVAERMIACLTADGIFGNPASRSHVYGWQAEEAVESSRATVADALRADPREIVWTSGATESNNLAIKGVAQARQQRGKHIVTAMTEHKAVLDTCQALEQHGFEVTYLRPGPQGHISAQQVEEALRSDTILVSLMHVNNETGVVNDVAAIGAVCRARDLVFHVDAAQSAGKLPLDTQSMAIDLLSISAHKIYGPKGSGALYVRRKADLRLEALIHGGGHERGMRSGTLATHQIVGLAEALDLSVAAMGAEQAAIGALRERFWQQIQTLPGVRQNGAGARVAGILNVSFGQVDGENLLIALRDLAISSGSACTSASLEPSYVLTSMGVSRELAHSSLRFSFGRTTTPEEVDRAAQTVCSVVTKMQSRSSSITRA